MSNRSVCFSLAVILFTVISAPAYAALVLGVDINGQGGPTTAVSGWSGWDPGTGDSTSTTIGSYGVSLFTPVVGSLDERNRSNPSTDSGGGFAPEGLGLMYRDFAFIGFSGNGNQGRNVMGVSVTGLLANTTYDVKAYAYEHQGNAGRVNFTTVAPPVAGYDVNNFPAHVGVNYTPGFNEGTGANAPPAGATFQFTTNALGLGSFYAWGGNGINGTTTAQSTYLSGFSISSLALADIDPALASVNFTDRVAGTLTTQGVTLNEVAGAAGSYTSTLAGNATVTSGGSGSIGASGSGSISVGINTASAGAKSGTVTINDPNADVDQIAVSGDVFDPSSGAFLSNGSTSLSLDLGTFVQNSGVQSVSEAIYNVLQTVGYTVEMDFDSITGGGDTGVLFTDLVNGEFAALAAGTGSAYNFLAKFDTNNSPGTYSATYTLGLSDASGYVGGSAASSQSLSLTLTGTIIPEPGAMVLFVLGSCLLGAWRRKS